MRIAARGGDAEVVMQRSHRAFPCEATHYGIIGPSIREASALLSSLRELPDGNCELVCTMTRPSMQPSCISRFVECLTRLRRLISINDTRDIGVSGIN